MPKSKPRTFDYVIDNNDAKYFANRYNGLYQFVPKEKIYELSFVANRAILCASIDEALEVLLEYENKQSFPSLLNLLFE